MSLLSYLINFSIKEVFKGKNIDEEFFQCLSGVSHYHFALKSQAEMIVHTFLLPGKNEICVNILLSDYYLQAHCKKLTFAMKEINHN